QSITPLADEPSRFTTPLVDEPSQVPPVDEQSYVTVPLGSVPVSTEKEHIWIFEQDVQDIMAKYKQCCTGNFFSSLGSCGRLAMIQIEYPAEYTQYRQQGLRVHLTSGTMEFRF